MELSVDNRNGDFEAGNGLVTAFRQLPLDLCGSLFRNESNQLSLIFHYCLFPYSGVAVPYDHVVGVGVHNSTLEVAFLNVFTGLRLNNVLTGRSAVDATEAHLLLSNASCGTSENLICAVI